MEAEFLHGTRAPVLSQPYRVYDDFLSEGRRQEVLDFLQEPGWEWGWRANAAVTKENPGGAYKFLHKHFAGTRRFDKRDPKGEILDRGYDCAVELKDKAPIVWCLWDDISRLLLKGHTLVRCYANGMSYGVDGTVHHDSVVVSSFTCIYYPHFVWSPDWAGETCFFNQEKTDVIGCVYPRSGRLVVFPGMVPHVARSVSRTCPDLRITLMFKTELSSFLGKTVTPAAREIVK